MKARLRDGCAKVRAKFNLSSANNDEFKGFTIESLRDAYPKFPDFAHSLDLSVWDAVECVRKGSYHKWMGVSPEISHSGCVPKADLKKSFKAHLPSSEKIRCDYKKKLVSFKIEGKAEVIARIDKNGFPSSYRPKTGQSAAVLSSYDAEGESTQIPDSITAHSLCCGDKNCSKFYQKLKTDSQ